MQSGVVITRVVMKEQSWGREGSWTIVDDAVLVVLCSFPQKKNHSPN